MSSKKRSRSGHAGSKPSSLGNRSTVADAWNIHEADLPLFNLWLKNVLNGYNKASQTYGARLTRRQRRNKLVKVEAAACLLDQQLGDQVLSYMEAHEFDALWSRKKHDKVRHALIEKAEVAIPKRVRRDVTGVKRLVARAKLMIAALEHQPETAQERKTKRGALKQARKYVDFMIWYRWTQVLGRPVNKRSGVLRAVAAIDQLLDLRPVNSINAIKCRFDNCREDGNSKK